MVAIKDFFYRLTTGQSYWTTYVGTGLLGSLGLALLGFSLISFGAMDISTRPITVASLITEVAYLYCVTLFVVVLQVGSWRYARRSKPIQRWTIHLLQIIHVPLFWLLPLLVGGALAGSISDFVIDKIIGLASTCSAKPVPSAGACTPVLLSLKSKSAIL